MARPPRPASPSCRAFERQLRFGTSARPSSSSSPSHAALGQQCARADQDCRARRWRRRFRRPALAANVVRGVVGRSSRPRASAPAQRCPRQGMLRDALGARRQPQQLVLGRESQASSAHPGCSATSVSSGLPRVIVPVLSSTHRADRLEALQALAALEEHAVLGARPVPTMIAVGVARPSAQGQATTSTAMPATSATIQGCGARLHRLHGRAHHRRCADCGAKPKTDSQRHSSRRRSAARGPAPPARRRQRPYRPAAGSAPWTPAPARPCG